MTEERHEGERGSPADPPQEGWAVPEPQQIPEPTYWPLVLALGVTLIGWGFMAGLVISALGTLMVLGSLAAWIGRMANGR